MKVYVATLLTIFLSGASLKAEDSTHVVRQKAVNLRMGTKSTPLVGCDVSQIARIIEGSFGLDVPELEPFKSTLEHAIIGTDGVLVSRKLNGDLEFKQAAFFGRDNREKIFFFSGPDGQTYTLSEVDTFFISTDEHAKVVENILQHNRLPVALVPVA
jgi:hypothetical protein